LKRSLGVLGVVLGLAVCLPLTEASGRHAEGLAVKPVADLALRASEVGPGYRAQVIPGGRKVKGQVTLDLCGFAYRSEALRMARIQLVYGHPRIPLLFSNEVVRYRGAGARLALLELDSAASKCPRAWRFRRISDGRLLPSAVAGLVRLSGTRNGKRFFQDGLFVYQTHGKVLSGVYAYGVTTAAKRRSVLRVAALSANKLRRS
jgi:hypothetical protein